MPVELAHLYDAQKTNIDSRADWRRTLNKLIASRVRLRSATGKLIDAFDLHGRDDKRWVYALTSCATYLALNLARAADAFNSAPRGQATRRLTYAGASVMAMGASTV